MMKRVLLLFLFLSFTIGLVACNTSTTTTTTTTITTTTSQTTESQTTTTTDGVAPIISGMDEVTIFVGDEFDPYIGVTAVDNIDGNLTHLITVSGYYDVDVAGVYTLTYTVQDQANNETVETRTLTVLLKPIDAAILAYEQAQSITLTILFVSGMESYVMDVLMTETAMRVDVLEETVYYEIAGEQCFYYEFVGDAWTKSMVECSEKGTLELQFLTNFTSEYFVEQVVNSETVYVLKMEHYASLQLFLGSTITSNFRMRIQDNQIQDIRFTMIRNSITFDMTITLSNINQTEVTLPEVMVP